MQQKVEELPMRDYINLIDGLVEAAIPVETVFSLPKSLPIKNYRITASFADVANWKAKILAANSAREGQNIGDWDEVGYVMINLRNNQIVPIARADEHQTGFDLLYDLTTKHRDINVQDYYPVFHGNNYVYDAEDVAKMTIAAQKWLAYGGADGIVKGANGISLFGTLSDLVKHKMKLMAKTDTLAPTGERLLKAFQHVSSINATRVLKARSGSDTRAVDRSFFGAAKTLVTLVAPIMQALWIDQPDPNTLVQTIATYAGNNNADGVEALLFGLPSVKNSIHQAIRQTQDGTYMRARDVQAMFGNLELANSMLGRI
jgi:hypothetical protein